MSKELQFLYEWIGPRGPIINTKIPDVYDLAKAMPRIDWQRHITTDDVNPVATFYRNYVPTRSIPVYDLGMTTGPFLYELTMSFKRNFESSAFQSGIGVFENVPINESVIDAVNRRQGWILITNHHESFVDDYTITKIQSYFADKGIDLTRVIYLSNCLNGQEIYERYCLHRGLEPKMTFEYAGIYLLDQIQVANDQRLCDRKYVIGPRKKTFLNFNRRYRPHRFDFLLRLFERNLLDKTHISFAAKQSGSHASWFEIAREIANRENINLSNEQIKELEQRLPLILDNGEFDKFPMEDDVYAETVKFYDESLVHIVSETNFEVEMIHITEKTMKPIIFKQPFIMIGPQHSLKYLRDMGFKTFGDIWDESYDDEPNYKLRMQKVMDLISEIDNLSDDDKILLQENVKEIVEYNFQHLRNRKHIEMQKFCDKYGAEVTGAREMKKVIVCGAGGFIGTHLAEKLKKDGYYVIGADLKYPEYSTTEAHEFHIMDLRDPQNVAKLITEDVYEIYQLAADMGGAGYIFTGDNDADIMHNSAIINLNVLHEMVKKGVKRVFYSSSACMYPSRNQTEPDNPLLSEDSAYPADPDSEYGWEKLFSERVYMAFARNHGIRARIARFHNIFGPLGSWANGKEKAPAALCRKVAMCEDGGTVEVWGPGVQTRSFLFIEECLQGIERIMASDYDRPLNLGSERMISINELVKLIASISGKTINIKNVDGPLGVMGRNSHNKLINDVIGWAPGEDLENGLRITYAWIKEQVEKKNV